MESKNKTFPVKKPRRRASAPVVEPGKTMFGPVSIPRESSQHYYLHSPRAGESVLPFVIERNYD